MNMIKVSMIYVMVVESLGNEKVEENEKLKIVISDSV